MKSFTQIVDIIISPHPILSPYILKWYCHLLFWYNSTNHYRPLLAIFHHQSPPPPPGFQPKNISGFGERSLEEVPFGWSKPHKKGSKDEARGPRGAKIGRGATKIQRETLQGCLTYPPKNGILSRWFSELPKVGYVNSLECKQVRLVHPGRRTAGTYSHHPWKENDLKQTSMDYVRC